MTYQDLPQTEAVEQHMLASNWLIHFSGFSSSGFIGRKKELGGQSMRAQTNVGLVLPAKGFLHKQAAVHVDPISVLFNLSPTSIVSFLK